MKEKQYKRKKGRVPKRIKPDVNVGLSSSQVEERNKMGYNNPDKSKNSQSVFGIIMQETCTFFNAIFFAIAIVLIVIGAYTQLTFLVVVIANWLIGIIQRLKSKKLVDKLSLVAASKTKVVRDGQTQEIFANQIVLDDVVILENGQQIPCDAIVLEGEVRVNESLLTGESVPITKKAGDTVLSGSFVVSGFAKVRADKVGLDTFVLNLANQAKKYKKPNSVILNTLNYIIKIIGTIIIPIAVLLFYRSYTGVENVNNTIVKTAGAILGMIPSGLFLLTSTALVVSVIRLAKKNILVQDLYCIEMLARVNTICMDKTGTITDGSMNLKQLVCLNNTNEKQLDSIIKSMFACLDGDNDTSLALKKHFVPKKVYKELKHFNFSSETKFSCVTFQELGSCFMGAPEMLLIKEKHTDILKQVSDFAAMGFRVMVVATSKTIYDGKTKPKTINPLGLIVLEDNIRQDAIDTIKYFNENGVTVRVISGDNPLTVSEVAGRAGIAGADKYISLEGLTDEEVVKVASEYVVFGRVVPHQKKLLIQALKLSGKKVAMIGDGVNDILALKEADCSVAIGGGADAARRVSQLILTDSNFCRMQNVVAEGRRVTNNIRISAPLFLTKTMFSVAFSIFCILFAFEYPFSPVQLILMEYFAIGLASFALALQPNKELIKDGFLRSILSKSALGAAVVFTIAVFLYFMQGVLKLTPAEVQTIIVVLLTLNQILVIARVSWPFNKYRLIVISSVLVCVIAGFLMFSNLYGTSLFFGTPLYNLLQIDIMSERGYMWLYIGLASIVVLLLLFFGIEKLVAYFVSKHKKNKITVKDYVERILSRHNKTNNKNS